MSDMGAGASARTNTSTEETDPSIEPKGPPEGELSPAAVVAIPAGYAVITGVLLAIGIQGETLTRLIRNNPGAVGLALCLSVVAILLPILALISYQFRKSTDRIKPARVLRTADWAGAVLLLAATVIAVISGVISVGEREQPIIQLTDASRDASDKASLTITSSALSLTTSDRMTLRIVGFGDEVSASDANRSCRTGLEPSASKVDSDGDGKPDTQLAGFDLIYWGDVGPTSTGTADSDVSLSVDTASHKWVCAFAALSIRDGDTADRERFSSLLVDLDNLTER